MSSEDGALEMMRCCGAWSYEHEQWRCCVGDGALLWGMVMRARAMEMVRRRWCVAVGHGHMSTSNGDDALEMVRCCGAWSCEHEQWR